MHSIHSEDFTHKGLEFRVTLYPDDTAKPRGKSVTGTAPCVSFPIANPCSAGNRAV